MELVIGGKAQGKRAYALGVARCMESDCSNDLLGDGKVLYDLQEIIRARLFEGAPEDGLHQEILAYLSRNPGCVVVCDEVGGGVVPMDSFERRWRECVGRVLCDLAQRASRVHRVFCGIGTVIKHG